MKRAFQILQWTFIAAICFLPMCVVISALFGYEFILASYPVFAILTLAIGLAAIFVFILLRHNNKEAYSTPAFSIVAPVSVVNAFIYLLDDIDNWYWIAVVHSVCIVTAFIFLAWSPKCIEKTLSATFLVLIAIPVFFFGAGAVIMSLIFGDFGVNKVVSRVENNDNSYYAVVVSSDQGALGGDTWVNVCKTFDIDMLVFKISDKPETVYRGRFGEHDDMDIYWKDDRCLVINGKEYEIE